MPLIDSRGHRRPLDPRRGVDEPRTVEVVRPRSATDRRRASPGIVCIRRRAWTAGKASPSRSAVVKHECALVSGQSNATAVPPSPTDLCPRCWPANTTR